MQELESTDFDEKKEINKRKQMILEGRVNWANVSTFSVVIYNTTSDTHSLFILFKGPRPGDKEEKGAE